MSLVVAICTEDGLDQICETLGSAALEMLDLKDMGCGNIRGFVIESDDNQLCWRTAEVIENVLASGKPFGRKAMRLLAAAQGVRISLHGPIAMTALALKRAGA